MSNSGATGSMVQLNSRTPVTDFLTGTEGDEQLTFFKGESNCYSAFATNWVKLNFAATTMTAGAQDTVTSAEVPRAGDMLCHAFLVIGAPAIANVSPVMDLEGLAGSVKRTFIHTGDQGSRETVMTYDAAGLGPSDSTITVAADLSGIIAQGGSLVLTDAYNRTHVTTIASFSVASSVTTITMADQTSSSFTYNVLNASVTMASVIAGMTPSLGTITYSTTDTSNVFSPTSSVFTGTVQLATSSGALNNAAASVFLDINYAPSLHASKTRASGPTGAVNNTALTSGVLANTPILDRGQIHANYGTYAPCALVKELEVLIGTNPIAKVTGLVLQANCELWTSSDRLCRRAVNKSSNPAERGAWALKRQTWVVPLPFWFNQGGYHSSLAMCALSFHSIVFALTLNPYTRSIINGCGGDFGGNTITVTGTAGSQTLTTYAGPSNLSDGNSVLDIVDHLVTVVAPSTTLTGTLFSFYLLLELVYLSDDERDTYTDMTDEILITQFQFASPMTLTAAMQSSQMQLRFNHPVSHLVVAGQLQSQLNDNRWCDYEGPPVPFTMSQINPEGMRNHWLKTMQISFNNNPRTAEQPAWFYHETMPSVSAERIPDHHFYLYPFGLTSPNGSGQFSGGADFSRLDTAILNIVANPHIFTDMSALGGLDGADTNATADSITGGEKVVVQCFGVSANVGKYQSGLFGVCFM